MIDSGYSYKAASEQFIESFITCIFKETLLLVEHMLSFIWYDEAHLIYSSTVPRKQYDSCIARRHF